LFNERSRRLGTIQALIHNGEARSLARAGIVCARNGGDSCVRGRAAIYGQRLAIHGRGARYAAGFWRSRGRRSIKVNRSGGQAVSFSVRAQGTVRQPEPTHFCSTFHLR